ncbi:MAG: zf-TFIIB domain-containing protein [Deltaproteobacteria bacterium]|nr:zf-TFIIB domain-containing protein [Deltaproteobacteria bacterium]
MAASAGALGEDVCGRCRGRFFPAEVAPELYARHLGVTPELIRELMHHFSGRPLTCPGCGKTTSRVQLRGEPLDVCTGCGGLYMPRGALGRLTAGTVTEVEVDEPPAPPEPEPAAAATPPAEELGDLRRHLGALPAALAAVFVVRIVATGISEVLAGLLGKALPPGEAHALMRWAAATFTGAVNPALLLIVGAAVAPALRRQWTKLLLALAFLVAVSDGWNALRDIGGWKGLVAAAAAVGGAAWALALRRAWDVRFAAGLDIPWTELRAGARSLVRRLAVAGAAVTLVGGVTWALMRSDERARRGSCPEGTERAVLTRDDRELVSCVRPDGVSHGPFESRYLSGQVAEAGVLEHGTRSGTWRSWHPDGSWRSEGAYTAGRRNGVWREWKFGGALEREGAYLDDKEDGRWVTYLPGGAVETEGFYVRGVREGTWKFHDPTGALERFGPYDRGLQQGIWMERDDRGRLQRVVYVDGRRVDDTP